MRATVVDCDSIDNVFQSTVETEAYVPRGDPIESLNPPSWVLRRLKTLGVETVGDLLRLSLSELSTESGSGTKAIEALIQKARHVLSVVNEGLADSSSPGLGFGSPSDGIDRVPEDSANSEATTKSETDSQGQLNELITILKLIPVLNRPWEEFLMLSSRVAHGLHQAQIKTLREVIVASQDDKLLALKNFGTSSLYDLRREIARLKPQLVSLCLGSSPPGVGVKKIREIEALIKKVQVAASGSSNDEETSASKSSQPIVGTDVSLPEKPDEIATILDRSWDEFLVLPIRVAHGLHNAKIKTLREAIVASQDMQLLELRNFGRKSLNDLRQAIGELELELGLKEERWQQEHNLHSNVEEFELKIEEDILDYEALMTLRQRLEQLGVAEQSCSVLGKRLSAKFRGIEVALRSIELVYGPQTLGSLAELLTLLPRDRRIDGIGKIVQALETVADLGLVRYLYGENAPSNISALVGSALETVSEADREILTYRLIDGLTLEETAQRRSLSRERIRQKIESLLALLQKKFSNIAQYLMTPLISEVNDAGGLLHYETVRTLTGETDLRRVRFGLLVAGEDTYRVWQKEFLTNLSRDKLAGLLGSLRDALRASGKINISIADVQGLAERNMGIRLDIASLSRLLVVAWNLEVSDDGRVTVGQLMKVGDQLAALLRAAAKPMHFKEVADICLSQGVSDVSVEIMSEDNGAADATDPISRRTLTEHALHSHFLRHEEIFLWDRGTFVHVTALPFSQERLNAIVEWCVRRIAGEPGPISTQFLLQELKASDMGEPSLNKYLLKNALSRHPDIVRLRKDLVGHVASFREQGVTLSDRIEAVLRHTERPLSSIEVHQRLPKGTEYHQASVNAILFDADFVLSLGNGRYCHIDSLGYSSAEREQIIEQAVCLLPGDGTPLSASLLLDQLTASTSGIHLPEGDQWRDILWALLRLDERVECGRGHLLALKSGEKARGLLEGMIVDALENIIVAFPRDVYREMVNYYGYRGAESTVFAALTRSVEKGIVRRLPQSLYCLPSIDDAALMNALKLHDHTIRRTLEDSGLADYPLEDLSLLARYLYQQEIFSEALRVLDILFTRADLSEEQRRSLKRLWTVIRQKQEGA